MISRPAICLFAAAMLLVFRLFVLREKRRGGDRFAPGDVPVGNWSLSALLGASFLTLFAELAFIRWISVEVRTFAYFKNLALLLCFLGFGLGCALARSRVRWVQAATAMMGLLIVVRWPDRTALATLSANLGAAADMHVWYTAGAWTWTSFLLGAALAGALLLLLVCIFIPLGQVVSRQMDLAPSPLHAYSWNLAGSLAGILAFFAACWLMLPPTAWLGAVLVGFALLQTGPRARVLMAGLALPAMLLLYDPPTGDHFTFWTPYQQIDFTRIRFDHGEVREAWLKVNHTGYQDIVNLSPEFLARHPGLLAEPPDENPYNVPFRFVSPHPSVLIVGGGSGNDAAAALRNGSKSVDVVEIDPAIMQLGKREHPEHPYGSPNVSAYVTDARAFLKRTSARYDLVLFGLLDSHTQLSDYSNMRIDNFVYTQEAFREAREHLNPDGVLFVKFQVDRPWIGQRLQNILAETFGKRPAVFQTHSSYSTGATCFAISRSGQVEAALNADPRLMQLAHQETIFGPDPRVPVTTDDWPYLYQEGRWIPRTYFSLAVLVILIALGLYWQIPEARNRVPSLFFFSMGAGFMLLETQVISRLALYFGTTWQVNGFVIAALLTTLLAANTLVQRRAISWRRPWIVVGLLAGLAFAYLFPFQRISAAAWFVGTLAAIIFSVPVFFAGLLFALEFRLTESPSAALGANMLGAVVGGLLENLSFIFGMRALLLVALGIYCAAAWGLRWRRGVGELATVAETMSSATRGQVASSMT